MRDKNGRFTSAVNKAVKEKVEGIPEKWCIKVTIENIHTLEKWRTLGEFGFFIRGGYVMYEGYVSGIKGWWCQQKPKECTEITFEQFKKYVLKEKELKMYTLKDLCEENVVVFLASEEEHTVLFKALLLIIKERGEGLCPWYGAYCYDISCREYLSNSTETSPGAYTGRKIIKFNQIILPEETNMEKKIVGYTLVKEQYRNASEQIMNTRYASRQENRVTVSSCIDSLKVAGVLDLWFSPIYEDVIPKIEIRGYLGEFTKDSKFGQDEIKFGCQKYSKDFILKLNSCLIENGFILMYNVKSLNGEVTKIADYFKS